MLKKIKKALTNSNGFTILELIVVIAIMGFLVALVAPKLAGVSENSKGPIDETNEQRLSQAIERNIHESNSYPINFRNLVPNLVLMSATSTTIDTTKSKVVAGETIVKKVDDDTKNPWVADKDNPSHFSREFIEQNNLYVHQLNNAEIEEMRKMGIVSILDYETGTSRKLKGSYNPEYPYVLMVGSGANGAGGKIPSGKITKGSNMGNPDLMYRIVLGIGDENGLVKENKIASVGTSPSGKQKIDFVKYNNYSIALPRLKATIARLETDISKPTVAPTEVTVAGYKSTTASGKATVAEKVFKINEYQDPWNFEVISPYGGKKTGSDIQIWKVTKVNPAPPAPAPDPEP